MSLPAAPFRIELFADRPQVVSGETAIPSGDASNPLSTQEVAMHSVRGNTARRRGGQVPQPPGRLSSGLFRTSQRNITGFVFSNHTERPNDPPGAVNRHCAGEQ